jgi:hypothetical protein
MAQTPFRPLDKETNYVNSWSELDNGQVARNVALFGKDGEIITATAGKLDVNATVTISGNSTETNQERQIDLSKMVMDMFSQNVSSTRYNQIETNFSITDPDNISGITVTKTNGGDASNANGQAVFTTSTNTSGEVRCITTDTIEYQPHYEVYVAFTAIFSAGLANSFQRIGQYDDNNGFFIGYEGTSFGITKRTAGVDTTIAQASFNIDTLTGGSTSKFKRNGTPEALDTTKDNLYRIRYGWLGAAPILFEIFTPDGEFIPFHIIRHPNSATVPTLTNTTLPLRLHLKKTTAGATNLTLNTACWAAGTTTDLHKLNATIKDSTLVKPVRAILAAKKPNGDYTNIDATAGGNLKVSIEEVDGGADLATETKQDTQITLLQGIAGLTPQAYDYISLSYTGSDLTGVVFKSGGSGGTTIATLTLTYAGGLLSTVTKT